MHYVFENFMKILNLQYHLFKTKEHLITSGDLSINLKQKTFNLCALPVVLTYGT